MRALRRWIPALVLLLALWGSRLAALESLPLHNDEGLHLTRALQVWRLHPFWEISDGKVVNHWPIALLYPQHAPVFAGRAPTVLVALLGLAAGYALVRRVFGPLGGLLAGLLWVATPYLFFFERLAQSDAQAGALAVLALWAAVRAAESGRARDAALTGLALASAALFKLTAAPFALAVALVVGLLGGQPWRRSVACLLVVAGVVVACFAPPLLYLALRGGGFAVALGWVGGGSGDRATSIGENLARLGEQLVGYGSVGWSVVMLVGLAALPLARSRAPQGGRRTGAALLLALLLPLALIVLLSREVEPRHYVVALPLALTLAGGGMGALLGRVGAPRVRWTVAGLLAAALMVGFVPFAATAYRAPGSLALPPRVARQYLTDHSAGFGLREAVQAFPQTIGRPGPPIIASMFPDGCRRANFYDTHGYGMACPAAPGLEAVRAALAEGETVYVLAESPPVGAGRAALEALGARLTRVAGYPRPGETEATASVTLWRLDRGQATGYSPRIMSTRALSSAMASSWGTVASPLTSARAGMSTYCTSVSPTSTVIIRVSSSVTPVSPDSRAAGWTMRASVAWSPSASGSTVTVAPASTSPCRKYSSAEMQALR